MSVTTFKRQANPKIVRQSPEKRAQSLLAWANQSDADADRMERNGDFQGAWAKRQQSARLRFRADGIVY